MDVAATVPSQNVYRTQGTPGFDSFLSLFDDLTDLHNRIPSYPNI